MAESTSKTTKLELRTAYGPVFRDVLSTPPRDCTAEEIPVLDLTPLHEGSLTDRKALAAELHKTAGMLHSNHVFEHAKKRGYTSKLVYSIKLIGIVNTGFFYIKNHGIPESTIQKARQQLLTFFKQPADKKELVTREKSQYFNGWRGAGQTNISPGESVDINESLAWRYEQQYDPDTKVLSEVPEDVWPWIRGEGFVWEGTSHLEGFKEDVLAYWGCCLTLARKLVKVFALSLDL